MWNRHRYPPHLAAFSTALVAYGLNAEQLQQSGKLILLDAAQTLAQFTKDGKPDPKKFDEVVGNLVRKMHTQFPRIRAYGEMVGLLWQDGHHQATVQLEKLWNELGSTLPFSLFCGYSLDAFKDSAHTEAFAQICACHSHVSPSEDLQSITHPHELMRKVALLEQQAKSMHREMARRLKVEEELKQALRARDDFMSICSHELKTPLTSLKLNSHVRKQFLARGDLGKFTPENLITMLNNDDKQVNRLNRLVDDMLDVTRVQTGKLSFNFETANLSEVIRETVHRFGAHFEVANCAVYVSIEPEVTLTFDRFRIEQVLNNLLTNALKFGPGRPIEVRLIKKDKYVDLTVKDYGVGISAEDHHRVFAQFERLSASANISGLGLGLYIAKQIVEGHEGSISVDSVLGAGSTFTVKLPVA